jgi:CheY-like chemotaxis protein
MAHKLLLADDSVTIQRVIELTFADEDVQVIAVGDGKKAIASIQADRPDIVLADVGMPERDGYEVSAFIKGTAELAHIPVLLLTGAFEPIDETRARAVGCDGVLVKPFEPQMVISRVKDLLAGRKPAGLWAASPAAQTPLRQPAPPAPDPNPAPAAAGGSLEDYFDRLDAAFASLDGPPGAPAAALPPSAPRPSVDFTPPASHQAPPQHQAPPPHQAPAAAYSTLDDLGGWDPDLAGDPKKPVPLERAAIEIEPPGGHAPVSAPAVTPAPPPPAYTAPPAPAHTTPPAAVAHAAAMPSLAEAFATLLSAEQGLRIAPSGMGAPLVTDEMVDEIVRRVIARMADQAVRETVIDVAERLVREEIERIKRG